MSSMSKLFEIEWRFLYHAFNNRTDCGLIIKLLEGANNISFAQLQGLFAEEVPQSLDHFHVSLLFLKGKKIVQDNANEPLFAYHGNAKAGFSTQGDECEKSYNQLPEKQYDKIAVIVVCDSRKKIIQDFTVADCMQVYSLPEYPGLFTDKPIRNTLTMAFYNSNYRLANEYMNLSVVHSTTGSKNCFWCPFYEKLNLVNAITNQECCFYNHADFYQLVVKRYPQFIRYKDEAYVLFEHREGEVTVKDDILVMFGRDGIELRHYTQDFSKCEMIKDYELKWRSNKGYVPWSDECHPEQGLVQLRVSYQNQTFNLSVYYVPFVPTNEHINPIRWNCEKKEIDLNIEGQLETQENVDSIQLIIGNDDVNIRMDVYSPIIKRELYQRTTKHPEGELIETHNDPEENIEIPLCNYHQFYIRDYSINGMREYHLRRLDTIYYDFPTFTEANIANSEYTRHSKSVKDLFPDVPLDHVKVYITKDNQLPVESMYGWDYHNNPEQGKNDITDGIIFQSLKDDTTPRHYVMPNIQSGNMWNLNGYQDAPDILECFENAKEHRTYFFLFRPFQECVRNNMQVSAIFLPLLAKREYNLNDNDLNDLYLFALHFHFDWFLLPRKTWQDAVNLFTVDQEIRKKIKTGIIDFFSRIPKYKSRKEQLSLENFLTNYWQFNLVIFNAESIQGKAISCILGQREVNEALLKEYDSCQDKFSKMDQMVNP